MTFMIAERDEFGRRYLASIAAFERTGIPWIGESAHFWFIAYCYGKAVAQRECL